MKIHGKIILVLAAVILLVSSAIAVPPHPELEKKIASGKIAVPYYLKHKDELHQQGVCSEETYLKNIYSNAVAQISESSDAVGPFNVLALLVEFSDNAASTNAIFFDSMLFDTMGNTVRDYYDEISYGQLDLVTLNMPSSIGWQTAPQSYAYYVDNQNGFGAYPQNAQRMVEDLVDLVDGSVDFSNYDNDNNGFVDVLVVIHAGPGAEYTGDSTDIWSHKWSTRTLKNTNDGVYVYSYTAQPEYWSSPGDMTIGVYAHELGHGFGLPDLYDTDYSSHGIGKWGLMSTGSWNGPGSDGSSPAHPCAWSRIQMGFTSYTNVTTNTSSQLIHDIENSGEVYRLWTSGNESNEYFLLENRQKTGYDAYLPGSGLLIWHIDDNKTENTQEWWPGVDGSTHYNVALKQADGLYELEHNNDYGDANDPFPGGGLNTTFNAVSSPSSDSYQDGGSFVAVDNILSIGSDIIADFTVGISASIEDDNSEELMPASFELAQNYPNPFNPTTTISFTVPQAQHTSLEIYNIVGQKVRTLVDEFTEAGTYTVDWNADSESGQQVSSGIYLYRLISGEQKQVKKMTLLK